MKEGWKSLPISRTCELFTDGNWIETKDQSPSGIRLVQTGNIGLGVFKDRRNKARFISESTFTRLKCQEVNPGDCLVSRLPDPVGRSCIVPETGDKMITAVDCTIIRFDQANIIPEFFNYYSQSDRYLRDIDAYCTGATRKRISRSNLGKIELPLPPLPEQKRIVAILDEAFAGIDTAIANTEKNLANARELFESYLQNIFKKRYSQCKIVPLSELACDITDGDHMPPPKSVEGVPFVTIKNIDKRTRSINFDRTFLVPPSYFEKLKDNRKPRRGDVLYTVTGSYGIPVVVDHDKAFCFQRHIGLIRPSDRLESKWLYYLLLAPQVTSQAEAQATGTAQKTVSLRSLRGFKVPEVPLDEQHDDIVLLNELCTETSRFESIYRQKLTALTELKQSLLQKAFSGELTTDNVIPITAARKPNDSLKTDSPAFSAHIMAVAYHWHESKGKNKTFGHVKAQKTLHLMEDLAQIDLGRAPIKDAAGPNDFAHMRTAEKWAKDNDFYEFVRRPEGQRGYDFVKGKRYSEWLAQAMDAVEPYKSTLDRVVGLLMPLDTQKAELVATVYAAWNNLLLDGHKPTEADIVHEARDNWHRDKQRYTKQQFCEAVDRLRSHGMVPTGIGKRVSRTGEFRAMNRQRGATSEAGRCR